MDKYKQYFAISLSIFLVIVLGHMLVLIIIDPLGISMINASNKEFYVKEMRFQSASIINKEDFDSVVIGSSMAENFKAKETNKQLGGKFHNLSLSGSLLNERKIVLDYALSRKDVKTVIMSLDGVSGIQRNKGIPVESWAFLYNESRIDDMVAYTNRKFLRYASCHSFFNNKFSSYVFGRCPTKKIRKNIEDLTEWQSNPKHNKRFGGVENWIKHQDISQVARSINEIKSAANLLRTQESGESKYSGKLYDGNEFSRNILPLIKAYPRTRFIIFVPPYSIYKFAIDAQTRPDLFFQYKKMIEQVVLDTESHQNAEVYWFNDAELITDIANYKDLTHYNAEYIEMFLEHFSSKRSLININNYKRLINDLEEKANKVDLVLFANKFN